MPSRSDVDLIFDTSYADIQPYLFKIKYNLSDAPPHRAAVRGAVEINEKRKGNGLEQLIVYAIELVEEEHKQFSEEETKVSSSNGRKRLLGTVLRESQVLCIAINLF
ncbi:unnamed protein product [Euphydryas editha]|uniref:Uncharacterized protein n=1 Tax=Euphydryas editha TaxID=104508 RepID=A0AAU9UGW2_EUPED|nr:unnamed protein product [Euphydryas editha]